MIRVVYFLLGFGVAWIIATLMVMKRDVERKEALKLMGLGWLDLIENEPNAYKKEDIKKHYSNE